MVWLRNARVGRLGCMAGAAMLLAACAGRDPYVNGVVGKTGEWTMENHTDRVTGDPVSNSFLATQKVSYGAILFPPPAKLQLVCFKGEPAVLVGFAFKIGSTRNAEVAYRFDEKPGHVPYARIVDNHRMVVIDDPVDVQQFVNEMATAEKLYLRIRSFDAPRTSAEFKVAGAAPMIAAAYVSCPISAALRANASTRKRRAADDDN